MSSLPKGYGRHTSFLHGWSHSKSLAHQNTHFGGSEVQEESRAKHCLLPGDLLPPQITASRPRNENEMKTRFMHFKALFSPWRHRDFFRCIDSAQEEGLTELHVTLAAWDGHQPRGRTTGMRHLAIAFQPSRPSPARGAHPHPRCRSSTRRARARLSPARGVGMRGENRLVSS